MDVENGKGDNKKYKAEIEREWRKYINNRLFGTIRGIDAKILIKRLEDNIISHLPAI